MTINSELPILFPSRANELPIKVSVIDGSIETVSAMVDSVSLRFSKDNAGLFISETVTDVDSSFLSHIACQLNRMFG